VASVKQIEKPTIGRILFGRPLATEDMAHQSISNFVGLAVFASDALSSTAYATEEILVVLVTAGLSHFVLSIPIAIAIAILLLVLTLSYRQTIHAYPSGGGAYIVARDNLGELPAQIAGAALLTDYVLTVAVSISSGVAQIASGIPALQDYRIEISLLVIIIITVVNLRGVKESGQIFAIPTYFFLGMAFLMIAVGAIRFFSGSLVPITNVQDMIPAGIEPLTLFLVLRAFSSGCTALTGVEAISNGITAFKTPKSQNAATTLTWMSGILVVLFLGFTLLARQIEAVPSNSETVISQMARAVFGSGNIMYFLMLAGTSLILLMAANTSYADFPRLAALQAGDGFLPRQLTIKGSRLVFTWGISVLGGLASLLIVFFRADTSALIPLYAIGVFLSFTMSQGGMVVRFWKSGRMKATDAPIKNDVTTLEHSPAWRRQIAISGLGAVVTGVVMVVFVVTKFSEGAWFVTLLIPCMVFVFSRIHHHYQQVAHSLRINGSIPKHNIGPVLNVVLVDNVHLGTLAMVDYAKSTGIPWKAFHIEINPDNSEKVIQKWAQYIGTDGPQLTIIPSPFRQLIKPLHDVLEQELAEHPEGYINVILGHLVMDTYWEQGLHQNSQMIVDLTLQNLSRIAVTKIPYQIHHAQRLEHSHPHSDA
jgi:amino acid transporter